jgi:hypothetical protein
MGLVVVALPREEYDAWLAARQRLLLSRRTDQLQRGRRLFFRPVQQVPCTFAARRRKAERGPDLTHIGSRRTLGAGTLPNNRGNLCRLDRQSAGDQAGEPDAPHLSGTGGPARAGRIPDEPAVGGAVGAENGTHERLAEVNNQPLGVRFMVTAFIFFLIGGVLALLMRIQLAVSDNTFLGPETYNQLFTMHGSTMMFLFAVPFLEGLALYMLPLMIGSRDVAFPRLTAFGYWATCSAG